MVAKMHRIHIPQVGEAVLHLPSGIPFEADAIPLYAEGTFMRLGRKEFIYATAGNSLIPDVGAKQANNQKVGQRSIDATYLAGVKVISFSCNVSLSKNELAGGEIVVFPSGGNKAFLRGIASHPAVTATASLELTLDSPIPVDIDSSASLEAIINPYEGVKQESSEWRPVMGMPTVVAVSGEGLWLQVSGLSWCALEAEVGAAVNDLEVCFGGDGALKRRDTNALGEQRAGMVVAPNVAGNGQGASFIMLNIDH